MVTFIGSNGYNIYVLKLNKGDITMFNMLIVLFALIFTVPAFINAQDLNETDVPSVVIEKFDASYGTTNNVRWVRGDNGNYVAVFVNDNFDNRITYNGVGDVVMREVEMDASTLPDPIMRSFMGTYPDGTINSVTVMEDDSKTQRYRLDYLLNGSSSMIYYNSDGTVYEMTK